jgi:acetyl-CoA C-acetyltransferase
VAEAYIVGAVRTPVGKRNGGLSGVNPVDMAAHVLTELVSRTGVDASAVDDVIMGCVSQIGPQSLDIARQSWLSAGLPEEVPGVTVDRQCGSSQQAVHFAAQAVLSGTQDLVVAAGVESMSQVPMGSSVALPMELGLPFGEGWKKRYGDQEISQFRGAQLMCEKWKITRAQLEDFALESHARAVRAIDEGRFTSQITELAGLATDEGPRRDPAKMREKMATLEPLRPGWELTAATASQISDGSAALLIASEEAVHRHGLTPRARIHTLAVTGADPVYMLTGPIPATGQALTKAKLDVADIDVFEVNEAFAPVLLAWSKETGASLEKTNPNGGAIALGHPLGATGAILMTKMLYELERTGGRYGLQTMCEGGGQANATIIERIG